jgi:Fic family protein
LIYACKDTIEFTKTIGTLQKRLQNETLDIRKRASLGSVLNVFFEEPFLTVKSISGRAKINHITAQNSLQELIQRNIVVEITGKSKGRIYACTPVVEAIFGQSAKRES